jgi:hypothetical protein
MGKPGKLRRTCTRTLTSPRREGPWKKCRSLKPDPRNSAVRHFRGLQESWTMAGTRPSHAPEFYPDYVGRSCAAGDLPASAGVDVSWTPPSVSNTLSKCHKGIPCRASGRVQIANFVSLRFHANPANRRRVRANECMPDTIFRYEQICSWSSHSHGGFAFLLRCSQRRCVVCESVDRHPA